MILTCPKCQKQIESANINVAQDVAFCAVCQEAHKLSVLTAAAEGKAASPAEPAKKVCPNCSLDGIEGKSICPRCGTPLGQANVNQTQDRRGQSQDRRRTQDRRAQPPAGPAPKAAKKNKPATIILIAAAGAVVVAGILIAVLKPSLFFKEKFEHSPFFFEDSMALIQPGTFTIGSPQGEAEAFSDAEDREYPQHRVTIKSFYLGMHEVAQEKYIEVMGNNPSAFKGENLPVENVTWLEAVEFCNKLTELENKQRELENEKSPDAPNFAPLTPAYAISGTAVTWNAAATGYRLPTEAEWEYACRAGTTTAFSTGANITTDQANYDGASPYRGNPRGISRGMPTPAETFLPSVWKLYDMHGNVKEWCWDWYAEWASNRGAQNNPQGPNSGTERVVRGGSWNSSAHDIRSAFRLMAAPTARSNDLGFRIAKNAD